MQTVKIMLKLISPPENLLIASVKHKLEGNYKKLNICMKAINNPVGIQKLLS